MQFYFLADSQEKIEEKKKEKNFGHNDEKKKFLYLYWSELATTDLLNSRKQTEKINYLTGRREKSFHRKNITIIINSRKHKNANKES